MYAKNVYKYDESKRREHMAVRTTVGWYLWTHQLIEVKGKDAAVFLDLIFANPIATLKVGRERYTTMLNEQAEIIDDVVVIRLEEEKFWISTLFAANMLTWLTQHKNSFCVEMEDVTKQYHMYAVQGPNSRALVNALVRDAIDELKFFSICDNWIEDVPVKINRAGFTGEKLGYEIYIPSNQCQFLENKLRQYGEPLHAVEITEFQIMAWTLPTEAGFYYMRDLMHTNPLEVGLERGIGWEKEFIGKGISYCATCDGAFFADKSVAVIGSGDAALGNALYLSNICKRVTLIHRRKRLRAAEILAERFFSKPNTEFIPNDEAKEFCGDKKLTNIILKSGKTLAADGAFIAIGQSPQTKFISKDIKTNVNGYIITDNDCITSEDGIFAIGDVREKTCRQIITAAADGAVVSQSVLNYINSL